MSVSTYINNLPSVTPLPIVDLRLMGDEKEARFVEAQNHLVLDRQAAQERAEAFISNLQKTQFQQNSKDSPLQKLLERTLKLHDTEESKQIFAVINSAFFKQRGYVSRLLFSHENWEEWCENRTALGKVASLFKDCMESSRRVRSFTKGLDEKMVQQANDEADALFRILEHRTMNGLTPLSVNSCASRVIGGMAASLLIKNPLPLLIGLSDCLPIAHGQQADIEKKKDEAQTSLLRAVLDGNEDLTENLLEQGADTESKNELKGQTPLHDSSAKGQKEIDELLLENRADIETVVELLFQPLSLHRATEKGQKEIVELLLAKGVDIEARDDLGRTPLKYASERGQKEITEILLEKGADIDTRNKLGLTPLHFAAEEGQKEIAEMLLKKGADVDARENWGGDTSSFCCKRRSQRDR